MAKVQLIPINKLTEMSRMYAVLDTLNMYEAGYIRGVMAHL